jgi:signal transduction histidine kinase
MQVFTSVLVLVIMFLVFIVTDVKAFKQRKVDSVRSIAQVIGTNSISVIQFQDENAAMEMLNQLHKVSPDITEAAILNKKGQVFARYSPEGIAPLEIPADMKDSAYLFGKNKLLVTYPIVSSNEVIGKIFLVVRLTELQKITSNKYRLAILLLLVAIGFTFIIANIIQRYISKRLLMLVDTMKKVNRAGDYSTPLVDEGKDEIAILIKVFNRLMAQIQENVKKKDEFIGIASHELKTPLTTIKGYIEMLKMMEDQPPKKQFVESAFKNVLKLEDLVKDLLDVSKIESGQLQLEKKKFDLSLLIDETIASAQMISTSHKIVREGEINEEIICGDRKRIEQVLINLLSNAVKYSPGQKEVIVSLQKNEKELIIKIRDFGIGIPEEEHELIFDRFYRTRGSSVHISGFGLGLYICRDIIRRHGGKIWIESKEKGTMFNFSLPITDQTQQVEQ